MWNCPYSNDSFGPYAEDIDGATSQVGNLLDDGSIIAQLPMQACHVPCDRGPHLSAAQNIRRADITGCFLTSQSFGANTELMLAGSPAPLFFNFTLTLTLTLTHGTVRGCPGSRCAGGSRDAGRRLHPGAQCGEAVQHLLRVRARRQAASQAPQGPLCFIAKRGVTLGRSSGLGTTSKSGLRLEQDQGKTQQCHGKARAGVHYSCWNWAWDRDEVPESGRGVHFRLWFGQGQAYSRANRWLALNSNRCGPAHAVPMLHVTAGVCRMI